MAEQIKEPEEVIDVDEILNDAAVELYGVNDELARQVDKARIAFILLMSEAGALWDELNESRHFRSALERHQLFQLRRFFQRVEKIVVPSWEDHNAEDRED